MIAAPKSTPGIDRPDPLPRPLFASRAITSVGLPVLDPPRNDPDHAGMPAFAMDDSQGAVCLTRHLRLASLLNLRLDRTAFFVEL